MTVRPKLRSISLAVVALSVLTACGKGASDTTGSPASAASEPVASASVTAVASPSSQTFSDHGVSFEYPADWQPLELTGTSASTSGDAVWMEMFGPGPGADFVSVVDYTVDKAVTADTFDQQVPGLTGQMRSLFEQTGGSLTDGPMTMTLGGLPAVMFEGTAMTPDGTETGTRLILAFDGTTEYFVNCQWTPAGQGAIQAGCDQIASSFALG